MISVQLEADDTDGFRELRLLGPPADHRHARRRPEAYEIGGEQTNRPVSDYQHAVTRRGRGFLERAKDNRGGLHQGSVEQRRPRLELVHEPCRDEHLVARTAFACKAELVVDLADVRVPCPAKSTAATGDYALGNTTIARPDILDARADSLGRSRPLMSDRQGIADIVWIDLAAQEL